MYSCPPIEALKYCDSLNIEKIDEDKTTFLFYKGMSKFRLTLKNINYTLMSGYIDFHFSLNGKQLHFTAIKNFDHANFEKHTYNKENDLFSFMKKDKHRKGEDLYGY